MNNQNREVSIIIQELSRAEQDGTDNSHEFIDGLMLELDKIQRVEELKI